MIKRIAKTILPKSISVHYSKWRTKEKCDEEDNPVHAYTDGSWIEWDVTPDQKIIEEYLGSLDLKGKKILHVGIGSSRIAKKFSNLLKNIDGITVVNEEKEHGDSLNIKNYKIFLINKYGNSILKLKNKYGLIIDNNLSSYACCKHHFYKMVENYLKLLKSGGLIITDKLGCNYFVKGFGINYRDLMALEKIFPIKVSKAGKVIYVIEKI